MFELKKLEGKKLFSAKVQELKNEL